LVGIFSVVVNPGAAAIKSGMRFTMVAQVNSTVAGRLMMTSVVGSP
jgi:hypothetical protein